ncbi:sugar transferase [Fusobacterium polymorphum]|jgi:exopolysaccharide biosynthesis polyprenyl glycosylphosphotransferase|uniref:Polyprenyl glycosylphosphotransferase n=1 Tax=Fusobacterium nucleatum subsp. polymorphum TaxID=76857 RepID=A0AAC8WGH8_FUSNP|nr:sugar transferase [Fusobacterium polymorphum]ALM94729.1 polyprenyl glycosylphosphotransferase [Fusobacterium polymorphum]ALQ43151.1 polyprenyl glycosylphosphotransferase [Fusobacterium polymorphum]QYR59394.1 sugar transferase [Fusobacterium polymorphum]
MKLDKKFLIATIYLLVSYTIYNVLLRKMDYTTKYLTNSIFLIYVFVKFIFGQLDFYADRFRLKDVFINFGINLTFSLLIFMFLKKINIFTIFIFLFTIQIAFRRLVTLKYVKKQNVLIFGSNHIENNVQEDLICDLNYEYKGYISNNVSKATKYLLGSYDEMEKIIEEQKIDMLVIVEEIGEENFKKYLKRIFDLKINGLKVLSYKDFNESIQKKIDITKIDEEWLLESNGFDILNNESQKNIKRVFDLIIAVILIIMTIPILLITAIIIKLESPGPIVFKQFRIGKNMKKFKIYKFRSMRIHDSGKYSKYTLNNDERVTRFGKFIRKTRIDELPQLFCVLKGTMSFVGPRPEWDELVDEYEKKIPYYNLRHLIKPGITGWAQVMYPYGECVEDAQRKLEYDIYYLKNQDFLMDILTIMKTVKIVIFGKGK